MTYKKRPKNKQELPPKSGKKLRRELPKKTIVEFQFTTVDGTIYKSPNGRLKIMSDGGVSCLIKDEEDKWKPVKAKLNYIKMKTVIIRKENSKK